MTDSYPGNSRFLLKHSMPSIKAGCGVFSLTRMSIVPLFASHFCANLVGHDGAVVSQITNWKAIGLKPTGTSTENDTFCLENMDLFFVEAKTCGSRYPAVFLYQMGNMHPFYYWYLALFDGFVKAFVVKGRFEKSPLS